MADERKIYPPISDVPLSHMPNDMPQAPPSYQAPPGHMPNMHQAPPGHMPNMPQAPPGHMPNMPQAPPNAMPQRPPYPAPQVPLGPTGSSVTCPSCGAAVVSTVRVEPSTQTHLMALVLCLLCICCTCVPYCVDSCQNANHHCPNCDAYLGTYKR